MNSLEGRLGAAAAEEWTGQDPLTVERVRERFDSRSGHTIGVGEELMLLDPDTLELSPSVELAPEPLGDDGPFDHEVRGGQVEIATPACGNAIAAAIYLAEARLRLSEDLDGHFVIAAAGTHPLSSAGKPATTRERFQQLADDHLRAPRGSAPCGLHVHVAVPGADRALAVFDAVRSFLPELTALAANSPFLNGVDTGLASARSRLALANHRAGVPPPFVTWERFVDFVEWGRRGGLFPDASHSWWDLRPHPRYGTLELRAADAQTRAEDTAAVAAVFQALVAWLAGRYDDGEELLVHGTSRIAENVWRATRDGTRGWMVDLESGEPQETRSRVSRLLEALEPAAQRQGTAWALLTAQSLLADNGAHRQRYVAEEHGVGELASWLATETVSSARDYLGQRS